MKHPDFLKSLKTLKSRLNKSKEKPYYSTPARDNHKEKTYCTCKDSTGEPKYLYTSQNELEYILTSTNISLKVYPCPYEKGWHLTKV